MKTAKIALPLLFLLTASLSSDELKSFRDVQWKYPRVRTASKEKDEVLRQRFKDKDLAYPPRAILLRAFKQVAQLELWAADAEDKAFVLVHEYRICTSSGTLGPKRRFGDEQVPEGFYELDWFNPQSNFFLSLHISYPNASDRILGSHQNPGGDIFLHGNCASIGCIPITDEGIKEIYWLAVLVHNQDHQHLPIQIFPVRLTDDGLKTLVTTHATQPALIAFWGNLKQGYDLFERNHRLPRIKTRADGAYAFSPK
ncbi:MAG TPA: L,D-transpeptidase family protein [Candidatus Acidoferrales bacterium]|nr:L,D-transpeptidase family protein [Candidatus Acidoferrales bacterium]